MTDMKRTSCPASRSGRWNCHARSPGPKATRPASDEDSTLPQTSEKSKGWEADRIAALLGVLGIAICGAIYFFLHRRHGHNLPVPPSARFHKFE